MATTITGVKAVVRNHIMNNMVLAVKTDDAMKFKVMVLDQAALRLVNTVVKMNELMDADITLVEPLEKRRQPYPSMDAIYFTRASTDSVNRIIEDFTINKFNKDGRLYKNIHLFFLDALDDRLFTKLKSSTANPYIKTCRELSLDYMPLETQVFTVDRSHSLISFFGTEVTGEQVTKDYVAISKQIASFCISLNEFPLIRYASVGGFDRITSKLAALVYEELDKYASLEPDFPNKDPMYLNQNRCQLIICDRTIDTVSPLLHEFTYQAMANDLLPLTDNGTKYKYMFESKTDGKAQKDAVLDDTSDLLWTSIRHSHIAECSTTMVASFNAFLKDNSAAAGMIKDSGEKNKDVANLNDLKNMLASVPQFQELKSKFSVHLNMAQECLSAFNKRKLAEVAAVEQDLATGETAEGTTPKNLEVQLIPLLDDPAVTLYDKLRLLMLYVIGKDGVKDEDRRKLFEHAQIPAELSPAITNLALIGVKLQKTKGSSKPKKRKAPPKNISGDDVPYDLSRYVPVIKNVLTDLCEGTLSKEQFPLIRDPNIPGTYGSANIISAQQLKPGNAGNIDRTPSPTSGIVATSLRSTKPSWHRKTGSEVSTSSAAPERKEPEIRKGGRILMFVAGGATYSEVRSFYEATQTFKREVILGCTHLVTPQQYIDDLKVLRQPLVVVEKQTIGSTASDTGGSNSNMDEAGREKKKGIGGMFKKLKENVKEKLHK